MSNTAGPYKYSLWQPGIQNQGNKEKLHKTLTAAFGRQVSAKVSYLWQSETVSIGVYLLYKLFWQLI